MAQVSSTNCHRLWRIRGCPSRSPGFVRSQRYGIILTTAKSSKSTLQRGARQANITCLSYAGAKSGLTAPLNPPGAGTKEISVIYKFGGSSVADADCMRQVAEIVCAFEQELPCVVISAMGKTTNLLLEAGSQAITKGTDNVPSLKPLRAIKDLHRDTCSRLDLSDMTVGQVEKLLTELQQLLIGLSIMQEMTPRAKDSLVSFGERLSSRLFAGYLDRLGVKGTQFDAWDLGMQTTDEFTNAEIIYELSLPAVGKALKAHVREHGTVPVVTGFVGKAASSGAITTLGRGGSDLTATFLGAALGVSEVVVWKDVNGVLSADPRIVRDARVINELTFDEATELAYFGAQVLHPSAMFPAQQGTCDLAIRVRNSYNLSAHGTVIVEDRVDLNGSLMTSIVLKEDVHLLDISSTRMLGSFGFLARVFDVFRQEQISVDVVATSEISVSVTLDSSKLWSRGLVAEELENLALRFKGVAEVEVQPGVSIISLICNAQRSSAILKQVFTVLEDMNVNVKMISQGASKTNISLIVPTQHAHAAIQRLHAGFFGVSDECAASEAALTKGQPMKM